MAAEFPKLKRPTLILVTGLCDVEVRDQCRIIARWAGCPWLRHETTLDALSEYRNFPSVAGEEEDTRLKRVSFDATCSTALSILAESAPMECVLISTSLVFTKSHLSGLLRLMQHPSRRRLLIIECLMKDKFSWQRFVEEDISLRCLSWYEAKSWKDVENNILNQHQQGIDPFLRNFFLLDATPTTHRVDAIKLVIDPVYDFGSRDYELSGVRRLRKGSLFIEAMKELLICEDVNSYGAGDQVHVVNYGVWRRNRLDELGRSFASRVTTDNHWCASPGDCVFRSRDSFVAAAGEEAICEICDGKISNTEPAYYCQFCSLSFHHKCCPVDPKASTHSTESLRLFACYSCRGEFSMGCDGCIYRRLVKNRVVAPLLRHHNDQHHLLSMGVKQQYAPFSCDACGRVIDRIKYCCNICSSEYHSECLQLPLQINEHRHGGHFHTTEIHYSCPAVEGYEWCNVCYADIDPNTWVYTCQGCDYVAHLYCLFPSIAEKYMEFI